MGEHERDRERKGEKDKKRRVGASSILHEYSISRAGVISQAAYSLSKLSRRPTQPSITIRERNFASSFSLSPSQFRHVRENPDYVYYTRIFFPRLSMCYVAVTCCSACFSLLSHFLPSHRQLHKLIWKFVIHSRLATFVAKFSGSRSLDFPLATGSDMFIIYLFATYQLHA